MLNGLMVVCTVDDCGLRGPDSKPPYRALSAPKTTAHMLGYLTKSVRDASAQSICCTERKPRPKEHQIQNVQICNLAVLESEASMVCTLSGPMMYILSQESSRGHGTHTHCKPRLSGQHHLQGT